MRNPRYGSTLDASDIPDDFVNLGVGSDADLAMPIRGFRVGTAGDVQVTTIKGTTLIIPNMQAGEERLGWFTRIWATLTTATGIIGFT